MNKLRKIAFFDQDQTIYNGFSMHDFYLFMADNNLVGDWVYKRHNKINDLYWKKKIDYKKAGELVIQLTADCLADKRIFEVNIVTKRFIKNNKKIMPWVKPALKLLHSFGFATYIVSGSAQPVVEAVGRHIKVNGFFGSPLEIVDSRYTGKVINRLDSKEKLKPIKKILGISRKKTLTIGFGDSTGDIEMLSLMDYGFIVNPHQPEIYKLAKRKNWFIDKSAKTVFKRLEEIVNPP